MSDKVLGDFRKSKNFQIGVGPNIVVVDAGAAKDITTLTAKADSYAVIFDQKGLMAGVGLQGSKITKLNTPERPRCRSKIGNSTGRRRCISVFEIKISRAHYECRLLHFLRSG